MPIDRQTKQSEVKPVTPALSTRFRGVKAPLVPRLASSAPSSPVVTARKDFRTQKLSPTTGAQTTSLTENITPRSGLRNTRIGTASPATPVRNDGQSTDSPGLQSFNGNSPGNRTTGLYRLQGAGTTSVAARRISGSSNISKKDDTSIKFFHAGNSKTGTGSPKSQNQTITRSRPTSLIKTSSTALPSTTTPPRTITEKKDDDSGGKFFRANNIPDSKGTRLTRPPISTKLSSVSAPVARTRSPELARTTPNNSPHQSPRKNVQSGLYKPISPPKNQPIAPTKTTLLNSPVDRRNSIGSAILRTSFMNGHKKSASISTISNSAKLLTSPPLPRLQILEPPSIATKNVVPYQQPLLNMPASPETTSPRSASMASSKTGNTSVTSDTDHSEISKMMLATKDFQSDVGNTTAQLQSQLTPLAQAQANAANARRERKVLDLEISNSSLLAINKTLERELKKQSTELRRFRRLSRTGRLSFAPSKRSISGQSMLSTLSEHTHEDDDDDDDEEPYSEDDSEPSDEDETDPVGESSLLSSTSSTTARARQRARDERRLMLDLTKHQQLLLDSQKMSQSIRKCLNLSEELIKEGKKAIEYSVGIGDLKLGGRVLSPDDYEDSIDIDSHESVQEEVQSRRGLLSPSLTLVQLQEATGWLGAI